MNISPKIGRAAMVLVTALTLTACAATRHQESTGEYIDDRAISTKVKTSLLADKDVAGTAINVDVVKGVVQLSGFAKSEQERQKAGQLARAVGGVKEVKNDIRLR